jgi:manganese transport protein
MLESRPLDKTSVSLHEVHDSVSTSHASLWRRMLAFAGPAYLISVGYMDPGNWATDLEAGARFGYKLLWVVVLSNLMAILLQTLSARLGIVTRRDLAQACRAEYPRQMTQALWVLSEIAIVACDLAEVLGAAIGLNLLFKIPLLIGVLLTAADTLLLLWFTRLGIRVIEAFVLSLIAMIAGCFAVEIFWAKPHLADVMSGLIPHINSGSLYVAVGILGATVMPHNLYLHSALVQTRRVGNSRKEKGEACRFNFIDSVLALNGALLVNAAILILAGAVFFRNHIVVTEIQQAHLFLTPLLGTTMASVLFGLALICSGQSSTLTGTMAGQIVMEGFLHFRMRPWLRRMVTRCLAVVPAALTIAYAGDAASFQLLLLSQVILNIQLPFAVIPLVQFTNDKERMGEFANHFWVKVLAWAATIVILTLNIGLAWQQTAEWMAGGSLFAAIGAVVCAGFLLALLGTMLFWPLVKKHRRRPEPPVAVAMEPYESLSVEPRHYRRILVPLDHSKADRDAIANALSLASAHHAEIILLHVEEGVTSQLFGSMASTAEEQEGLGYLEGVAQKLRASGVDVDTLVRHGKRPAEEIAKVANELAPDLLVLAAHGHRGWKDLVFGTTINSVRHKTRVPLLIVRQSGTRRPE